MNKETDLSTFINVTGSVDQQVQKATGLSNLATLINKMEERNSVIRTDILVCNQCNQKCPGCFYERKNMESINKIDSRTIEQIDNMVEAMKQIDPSPYFYPREATCDSSLPLLPEYQKVGMKSILTNGKSLSKPKVIEALIEAGISDVTVTVPGLAESYAKYTGEPESQYVQLIEGIKKARNNNIKVGAFMPIFEQNVDDIIPTIDLLSKIGVSSVKFIRVIPVGKAMNLDDSFFLQKKSVVPFLIKVNRARLQYNSMKLSLFGQSFGPNFYSPGVWKYLAGQSNEWPATKYMCPAINQNYRGVLFGSNEVVSCFEGMCFEDQVIGIVNKDGKMVINTDNKNRSEETLKTKLRKPCSQDCPFQSLCLGGCRTAAMSEAVRRGEVEPEFAGQTICITEILRNEFGNMLSLKK